MVKEKLELSDNKESGCLNVVFGSTLDGKDYSCDLTKVYNILVGGSKGGGKSDFLKNIIDDLSRNYKADRVQFVLVDFKKDAFFKLSKFTALIYTHSQYS